MGWRIGQGSIYQPVATEENVISLAWLAMHDVSHNGVVALAAKAPDDVIAELRRHKWIESNNEVHITTLDGKLPDTIGCSMKGKGGDRKDFEEFIRSCMSDTMQCTCCLHKALELDDGFHESAAKCEHAWMLVLSAFLIQMPEHHANTCTA